MGQTKQEVPQKCMLDFLISQRWLTHQELIATEQFRYIMFFPFEKITGCDIIKGEKL